MLSRPLAAPADATYRAAKLAAALLVTALVGCEQKNDYVAPPPPEVTVAKPTIKKVTGVIEFTGRTEAVERIQIRARVEGFLESFNFREGQDVEEGQPLFVIDPRPFQAQLDAANANLKVAEAAVTQAQANEAQAKAEAYNAEAQLRRGERALRGGGTTEAEVDDLRTAYNTAVAALKAAEAGIGSANADVLVAKAALEAAKLDFSYTQIDAPISGRIGRRLVDIGNLVGKGEATLLAEIIKYDPIYVYFTVSETDFIKHLREHGGIKRNEEAVLPEDVDRVVRISLAGDDSFPFEGRFDFGDREIDSSTGTTLLRAKFENPRRLIPSGAFAKIQVDLDEREVMLIDDRAIGRDQSGPYVVVIDKDDTAVRVSVTTDLEYDGLRVIESDSLSVDSRIVVNGLQMARPGAKVQPKMRDASSEAPAAEPNGAEPNDTEAAPPTEAAE